MPHRLLSCFTAKERSEIRQSGFKKIIAPLARSLARVVTSALRVRAQWSRKNGLFALKWEAVRQTRLLQLFIFFYRSHRPLSALTLTISSGLPKSCLPLNWKGELVLAAASWRRNYNLNTRYTPRAQMETKSGSPYSLTTFDDGIGCIKTPRFVSC